MYTGTNPAAIRSQQWLSNALLALLEERPYSEINVKDICARCDLSRQTFYQMFCSKEELVRYCIRQRFLPLHTLPQQATFSELSDYFIRHIAKNKAFIRLIQRNRLGHLLAAELSQALGKVADRLDPERDAQTKPVANAFITAALTSSLLVWAQSEELSEQAFVGLLGQIIQGRYYKIF